MPAQFSLHRFVPVLLVLIMLALPVGLASARPTGKPTTITFDDTFGAPNLTARCGFEVIAHFYGTVRVAEDPVTGAFRATIAGKRTLTGPGGSYTSPDVGVDKVLSRTVDGNILVDVVASNGIKPYRIVIPGHGVISANNGRDVFQITIDLTTGEEIDFVVLQDHGLNLEFDDEDWAVICDHLAG